MQPDKNIDKLFRDNQRQLDKMPDERVWERLQQRLDGGEVEWPAPRAGRPQWVNFALAAVLLFVVAPVTLYMINNLGQKKQDVAAVEAMQKEQPPQPASHSPQPDGGAALAYDTTTQADAGKKTGESEKATLPAKSTAKPETDKTEKPESGGDGVAASPSTEMAAAKPQPKMPAASGGAAEGEATAFTESGAIRPAVPADVGSATAVGAEMEDTPRVAAVEEGRVATPEPANAEEMAVYHHNDSYLLSNNINMSRYYNSSPANDMDYAPPPPAAPEQYTRPAASAMPAASGQTAGDAVQDERLRERKMYKSSPRKSVEQEADAYAEPPLDDFGPAKPEFGGFAALAGAWHNGDTRLRLVEDWQNPGAGKLIGLSYTIAEQDTVYLEKLTIEQQDDAVFYTIAPIGQEQAVIYKLVENDGNGYVFARQTPGGQYPRQIAYRLQSPNQLQVQFDAQNINYTRMR